VIFLSNCKATTCYGCSGKFRKSGNDPSPPVLWDTVIRRKEFRAYHARGSDVLKISAKKEYVYYHHVHKQCILKKVESISTDKIMVEQDVAKNMGKLHKNQLRKEFGITLPDE
jgi:hypothetical protein